MKRAVVSIILLILSWTPLAAEEPAAGTDVDSYFSEENGTAGEEASKQGTDIISDLLPAGIVFGAGFSLYAGYSPGLNYLPGDVADPSQIQYVDLVLLKMTAGLSIDVRFSPDLKLFSRLSAELPQFSAEITELFCDFNLFRAVFVRVGRLGIVWGISPNYPFTNLLGRVPVAQTENTKTADSIACKASIPFGVGGLDLVAFSRTSLWDAPDRPEVDEIGAGAKFNLALANFDFSLGGYYHKDLPLRFFYALSTTLFGAIETYTEGLLATNLLSVADPAGASWYYSGNIGIYVDLFEKALRVNAEYFYCGETADLTLKGADFTFFPGHNVALNASLSLDGGRWKILLQWKHNFSQDTGYVIPAVTLDAIPHVTFSLGVPVTLGSVTGGYFVQNTTNNNRRICAVFAVIVKGSI